MTSSPLVLAPNLVQHSYRGGGAVARFRDLEPGNDPSPEDWIASVTTRWGMSPQGLSLLPDGTSLAEALAADPEYFLGPEHLAAFGPDPMLLVKLLESAERLRVHCHPDRDFARSHLGCSHGKTEAWLVLSTRPGGHVFLGFSEEVTRQRLERLVNLGPGPELLALLNLIPVSRGDSLLVPAGVPHAIGGGVFVLELQEPTDFSVVLETEGFLHPELGMGWETAFGCVDRSQWSPSRLRQLKRSLADTRGSIFPSSADPFFRADLLRARPGRDADLDQGFALIVVMAGSGELQNTFGGASAPLKKGLTVLLPHAAGTSICSGAVDVVVCRPPRPDSEQPARPQL